MCMRERKRERERERESCDQSVVITLQINVLYCNSTQDDDIHSLDMH